ncbi:translation elongation factor Ts [[Mycoplasma] mobile]|uniref:Elongation factor Ts n=1 Tax=Mycoplasma mobile (strain ATCC 43663 / 163K / NCTC 11711) TaxID=267748 RepID=EFTS_MYCM1|nr:translation elongation factor Ts [[Mycoplasma] mobile]Q6KIB3.1 RecName: Full=Elongation factor Ts; Short=EF-Ts [Mycoplasma mobile 163K]AAT27663.1 elongation factor ts [Mycoplasma mobile 163K]
MVDAEKIKKLREMTDSGFLDCKKALEATKNDLNAAVKWLQENGKAKAAKKADRITAEGLVAAFSNDKYGVIIEINSETDFVAKNQKFKDLVNKIGQELLKHDFYKYKNIIEEVKIGNETLAELVASASATIGEKLTFRRAEQVKKFNSKQVIGVYNHFDGQKAAVLIIENGTEDMAKQLSMHITAMNPLFLDEKEVPEKEIKKLRSEFEKDEQIQLKPEKIRPKIIEGMINKKLSETTFTLQEFVVEPGQSIKQYMNSKNSFPISKIRYEVGEGIEKQVVDFASEVANQMKNKA